MGSEIWPIVQTIIAALIAVAAFGIRTQIKRVSHVEKVLSALETTLTLVNGTIVRIEAAYEGHLQLDDTRFKDHDRRLDAHDHLLELHLHTRSHGPVVG